MYEVLTCRKNLLINDVWKRCLMTESSTVLPCTSVKELSYVEWFFRLNSFFMILSDDTNLVNLIYWRCLDEYCKWTWQIGC